MATPVADLYTAPTGVTVYGGRFAPVGAALSGDLTLDGLTAAGIMTGGAANPAPDFYEAEIGLYGLNPSSYLIGWPMAYDADGVASYAYSLDGGSNWTSTGTNVYAYVTGRTPGATDQVRVKATDSLGNVSSYLSRDVTLPSLGAVPVMMATVGTGGDYSTPQAAINALPANLVTAGQNWEILLFNQEWLDNTGAVLLDIAPRTTDATHTLRVTAFPGCSFADHPNRRTNPLRYNSTVGASLKANRNSTQNPTVDIRHGFVRFERLQVASVPVVTINGGGWGVHTSSPTYPVVMDQCIVESSNYEFVESFNYGPSALLPHVLSRCVIISNRQSGASPAMGRIGESGQGYIRHYNCLFVAVGQRSSQAHAGKQPTVYFENCGFFGVDSIQSVTGTNAIPPGPTYVNCFSDAPGTLPSGITYMDFSTATGAKFENITRGTHDLRLRSGSSLIGAGTVNTTDSPRDITGKSRGGSSNDVGPWQA